MERTAKRILKNKDAKLEGKFQLEIGKSTPSQANKVNVTSATAQVCLLENHPEFAVLEVTCGCGAKTHIRCEYMGAEPTKEGPDQKINGENENESE